MMRTNRHYITEEDGRSIYIKNGVVTPSSQPKRLPNAPAGANEVVVSWERISNRYGIQRTFTTPLRYVLDGARIIRHYFYNLGYEHRLFHLIQRLKTYVTDTIFRQRYEYLYKGEIDLSTFKDEGEFVTCNIMEGGLDKMLKAKESTVYEIPFDDDAILVKMDGVEIDQLANYIMPDFDEDDLPVVEAGRHLLPISLLNSEGINGVGVSFFSQNYEHLGNGPTVDLSNSINYFLNARQAVTISLKGSVRFYIPTSMNYSVIIQDNYGNILYDANPGLSNAYEGFNEFSFDLSLALENNTSLFIYSLRPLDGVKVALQETEINVSFKSRFATTYIKAFKPYDLFRKLVEKITGRADDATSTLLQSESNKVITSGDAIRGIEGAVIKTSLSDFYAHCNVVHFAGQNIQDEKIEIETRSKYYDTSDPIHLGNAKDLKISAATDLMGNRLKIGWQEPDVEDVNGKYSFNGSHSYESIVTRIPKEISLISPYSADPYEIEINRINLEGKTTTDDAGDNKVYCINATALATEYTDSFVAFVNNGDVNTIGAFSASIPLQVGTKFTTSDATNPGPFTVKALLPLLGQVLVQVEETVTDVAGAPVTITITSGLPSELTRVNYDTLTGVPTNQVFNIEELTPKRLLEKNGAWIRSLFYPFDQTFLQFTTTERNKDLLTSIGGVTVEEKANKLIGSLAARLFLPIYFEFETEVPTNLIELLEENPNRCFSFEWEGRTYKGFNVKVSIAINTEESQSVKLLCAPDVDTSLLANL